MREEKMHAETAKQEALRLEQERRITEYEVLGNSWEEESEHQVSANADREIQELEKYRYFDGSRIRKSMKAPKEVEAKGAQLYRNGKIKLNQIVSGFDQYNRKRKGQMDAVGIEGNTEFPIRIVFSRKDIHSFYCECKQCRRSYYSQFYVDKTECPYKAGTLMLLEDYLKEHNIGDSTDAKGQRLFSIFQEKRVNRVKTDTVARKECLQLAPRLTRKNGTLSLSFKIGYGKLFVIKKLDVFCENVRTSAMDTYGSNTELNHDISNFTDRGKGWIHFINRVVREEREFLQRLAESRNYYGKARESVGSALELFGWRLDEFYHELGTDTIEFEDKDGYLKKAALTCRDCNPKVTMQISEDAIDGEREFHGILVEGDLPDLYYGTDNAYYITEKNLNRVEKTFLQKLEPLAALTEEDHFSFHVGRNRLSEFYSRVMPQLQEIADITETQPEKFRAHVLPEARFTFYLDAAEQDVACRIYAQYGEMEVSVLDLLFGGVSGGLEKFRDSLKEEEILFLAMQWFPEVDSEKAELCCGGDEERIYQLMKDGTEKLMELGEVHCTRRFLGYHSVNRVKVSVGVSVSSGLLELDIATEDIPAAELLDILKSYRTKKKYYRLKSGSFVDLEEPSLEMLAELSQAMNLKDKELLKGRLKLPMYRTLYLDKLLEENDSVYSSRDSHFRKVVKGFKTVKDADFEEPASLSRLMRKYQKDGYKWLRTLETWQFGGILADDMGLGKTLQMIAVLLAAKEEGKTGTSLVAAPASLVFNWGVEFEKFAPDLNVVLVTGTQEERQKKNRSVWRGRCAGDFL